MGPRLAEERAAKVWTTTSRTICGFQVVAATARVLIDAKAVRSVIVGTRQTHAWPRQAIDAVTLVHGTLAGPTRKVAAALPAGK